MPMTEWFDECGNDLNQMNDCHLSEKQKLCPPTCVVITVTSLANEVIVHPQPPPTLSVSSDSRL